MKEETAIVPCVTVARQAESVAEQRKGQRMCASEYLRTESWEEDGTTSSRLVLICGEAQGLAPQTSGKTPEADFKARFRSRGSRTWRKRNSREFERQLHRL